ncbi:hypothetical protein P7C71_g4832, partial [Lecanoromycetidae sp. Uapishka_2]
MDDQDEGDGSYSDDDLDALPDHTLDELQENAVRSTQQPASRANLPPPGHQLRSEHAGAASGIHRLSAGGIVSQRANQHILPPPSSDYGDFDDEMLDGEVLDGDMVDVSEQPSTARIYQTDLAGKLAENQRGESTQREDWRQQRYSGPQAALGSAIVPTRVQSANVDRPADGNVPLVQSNNIQARSIIPKSREHSTQAHPQSPDVEALQAQVQKLQGEREALQQAIRNANDNVFSKAGEIAIVRANANKIEKDFEIRTQALHKLHADEAARQRIEVEKARAELQKIATEKDFLENDLAEGTKQIRHLQRAIKKGPDNSTGKENHPTTPRKNKFLPHRDGFDDDEVQPMSPSRLAIRSKKGTPKAGAKRKRKVTEGSPVKPLDLASPRPVDSFEEVSHGQTEITPGPTVTYVKRPDSRFQLTQHILDHRFEPGAPRTFERLATFAFPSRADQPLSTLLLDKFSTLTFKPESENFPAAIGLIIISLWLQCMEEGYHEPVHLLVDLIKLILIHNPIKTAPDLTNNLMSLVQLTADIILVPRCKKQPPRPDRASISATDCLEIMQMMAYDCQNETSETNRFWRTMRFDFIMMLLNLVNPLSEIHLMLSLLHTSILDDTFAMIIPPNNGNQDASEAHVIDNLSHLLINTPRPPPGDNPPDAAELCGLRLDVLTLFEGMCTSTHSASALATHRLVIGCLVRLMNDSLNALYDYTFTFSHHTALVNTSTRLLFHLTSNYAHLINMQAKLSLVPGGEKKYLIALTRLAFSEGGFYEGGIDDDVVDCAHQMLEARVSPEEAEGLVEAFGSSAVSRK